MTEKILRNLNLMVLIVFQLLEKYVDIHLNDGRMLSSVKDLQTSKNFHCYLQLSIRLLLIVEELNAIWRLGW